MKVLLFGDRSGCAIAAAFASWTLVAALACSDSGRTHNAQQSMSMSTDAGGLTVRDSATPSSDAAAPARSDAAAPATTSAGTSASKPPSDSDAAAPQLGASGASGSSANGMGAPSLCSGCSQEVPDKLDMSIHVHHVHMKVANLQHSTSFYEQFLALQPVKLNDAADALHIAPLLVLLDEVPGMPASTLPTAFQHIGFGSTDTGAWYDAAHKQGVAPDTRGNTLFKTNETPTIGAAGSGKSTAAFLGTQQPACLPIVDPFAYMYVLGPDNERVEICSGVDQRVNHLHFTTPDLAATAQWYQKFLGLTANPAPVLIYAFFLDDVMFFFEPIGARADYQATDNQVLNHVAFSVSDLDGWLKRARDQNIEILSEPALVNGFKSFFMRGPDGMLLEVVQAAPSKELCLNNSPTIPPSILSPSAGSAGGPP